MTIEEVHAKHEKDLKWVDELYADRKVSILEVAALKEEIDNEYRRNLSNVR